MRAGDPVGGEGADEGGDAGVTHRVRLEPLVAAPECGQAETVGGAELVACVHDERRGERVEEGLTVRAREAVVAGFQPVHVTDHPSHVVFLALAALEVGRQVGAVSVSGDLFRVADEVRVRELAGVRVFLVGRQRDDLDEHVAHLDEVTLSGLDVLVERRPILALSPRCRGYEVVVDLLVVPQRVHVVTDRVGVVVDGRVDVLGAVSVDQSVSPADVVGVWVSADEEVEVGGVDAQAVEVGAHLVFLSPCRDVCSPRVAGV